MDDRRQRLPPDVPPLIASPVGRADAIQALTTVAVLEAVRDSVGPELHDLIVDAGVGITSLTLSLASVARSLLAASPDPAAIDTITTDAALQGVDVQARNVDLGMLRLPAGSADVVVASDALFSLPNHDKRALVVRARRWLRPGGLIIVAGTMSRRQELSGDSPAVAGASTGQPSRRIGRNVLRRGLGIGSSQPASSDFWQQALQDAGFRDVGYCPVAADVGLAWGRSPVARQETVHEA